MQCISWAKAPNTLTNSHLLSMLKFAKKDRKEREALQVKKGLKEPEVKEAIEDPEGKE